jgi:hypothetical protein
MKKTFLALLITGFAANAQTTEVPVIYAPTEVPKPGQMKPDMTEFWEPAVPVISAGKTNADAPSDAIVLFNGTNLSEWVAYKDGGAAPWTVKDGYMEVKPGSGDIKTVRKFTDCQLHIEWASATEIKAVSQGRSNSGVFFQDRYEIQILDNYQNRTYANGQAGSIYKDIPPLVNPIKPTGEWNTYDIIYKAPRYKPNGKVDAPATVTVLFNGVLVQNNSIIAGLTLYIGVHHYPEAHGEDVIKLQDHGDKVRFKNIWIRPL